MTVLAYDRVWVEEPRLMVPMRRPLGQVRRTPDAAELVLLPYLGGNLSASTQGITPITATAGTLPSMVIANGDIGCQHTATDTSLLLGFTFSGMNAVMIDFSNPAEITTTTTSGTMLRKHADDESQALIQYGAATTYLTNERLVISGGSGNRRTGKTDGNIAAGRHVLAWVWTGSNYDLVLDGVQQTVVASADGHAPQWTGATRLRPFTGSTTSRTDIIYHSLHFYARPVPISFFFERTLNPYMDLIPA